MVKVTKNEQDDETSKKGKRVLASLKAVTLAGAIIVGSMAHTNYAQAQVAEQATTSDSEETLVEELDENFTWEFEDGVDRDNEKVTSRESADKEQPTEKTQASDPDVPATTDEPETSKVYIRYNLEDGTYDCATEKVEEEGYEYLLYLEDVDPAIVDENYTGVAPIDYYGPEHVVKNYGDASNDEEVKERAQVYWDAFHKANEEAGGLKFVDPDTGKEYTIEKLMDIIKYMNGAYEAKDAADAKRINDAWINFLLVFLNDDYVIEDVNYKANSDVITEEDVKKHSNILENIDLGHLLMGDSANGPFLQWFGDQIKAMYTTTDKEEAVRIYDETYLAIVAITEGKGYIINGVKYTIDDFSNVNDLVLDAEVLISQVLRNNMMEAGYAFNKKYVGFDIVFLTDVLNQYNPVCSDDLVQDLKDNGVEVYEGVVTHGNGQNLNIRNYASVMQMKAFDMALSNGEYGIKYYQDSYVDSKLYDEYIKAKNGGTYEDVLESEYVLELK